MATVLISAPYMLPFIERFRPVFEHYNLDLIIPEVHERLSEEELLAMPANSMARSAVTTATPAGCWLLVHRASRSSPSGAQASIQLTLQLPLSWV